MCYHCPVNFYSLNIENCICNFFLLKKLWQCPQNTWIQYSDREINAVLSQVEWILLGEYVMNPLLTPPSVKSMMSDQEDRLLTWEARDLHSCHSFFGDFKLVTRKIQTWEEMQIYFIIKNFKQNNPWCGGECLWSCIQEIEAGGWLWG